MTKLRNAVLAGVLVAGIGGAGVLTAAPAFAVTTVTGGGTLLDATAPAGQPIDLVVQGGTYTFSEGLTAVDFQVTLPPGVTPVTQGIQVNGITYRMGRLNGGWGITIRTGVQFTSITLPTFQVTEDTPGALQGEVTYDLLQSATGFSGDPWTQYTDDIPMKATVTWTQDEPDTPVIAPAIGGAAAIAGIGLAGIVLVRRRRNAEQA
jgi:hypothetical protein